MKALANVTKSGTARVVALALVLATLGTGIAVTHAIDQTQTHNLSVKVYDGDPAVNKLVPGVSVKLIAEDGSNPSNGTQANTDGSGTANFSNVHEGWFTVRIAEGSTGYNSRDYSVLVDADTVLEASLIAKQAPAPAAPTKFNLSVRVYDGDPAHNTLLSAVQTKLVADNASNPTNGRIVNTDGTGVANFGATDAGWFTVQIGYTQTTFYPRDYRVLVDADTVLEASLINKTPASTTTVGDNNTCLPTPPVGKPLLNIWPISESGAPCTDYHFLAAKNATAGTSYVTGGANVTATDGQIIQVELYVHNGVIDYPENIAHNVQVKASVPNATGTISAEAWADNADRISSAQKGGNVNVTIGATQHLEYIDGSTKLYDNTGAFQSNLPDGIVRNGVSIGDMRGCYQFLHFVTFQLKVVTTTPTPVPTPTPTPTPTPVPTPTPTPTPTSLTINKTVANVTTGTGYSKTVAGKFNDIVDFRLIVTNTGNTAATNVIVSDLLPAGFVYADSLSIFNGSIVSGNPVTAPFMNIGTLQAHQVVVIFFHARVNTSSCNLALTNTASAKADNAGLVSDSASITLPACITPTPNISVNKSAWNDTANKNATTITAKAGDRITYVLSATNSGDIGKGGYVFTDDLTDVLKLADLTDIDGATLNGNILVYPATDIPAHSTVNRAFIVKIKNPVPTTTDCVMTNIYGNVLININVNCQKPPFVAPPTGSTTTLSLILAALTLIGAGLYRSGRLNMLMFKKGQI